MQSIDSQHSCVASLSCGEEKTGRVHDNYKAVNPELHIIAGVQPNLGARDRVFASRLLPGPVCLHSLASQRPA